MKKRQKKKQARRAAALAYREAPSTKEPALGHRAAPVVRAADGTPASYNPTARTVDVIAATENPVRIFDWEHGEVDEVLLMRGCLLPTSRQIPLLDTHPQRNPDRHSIRNQVGSARELVVDKRAGQLLARAHFASTALGREAETQVAEGHATDFSVGYRRHDRQWIPEGEKAEIGGQAFRGPVLVVTSWSPKELSVCSIGADPEATARAANTQPTRSTEDHPMNKKLRAFLEGKGLAKDASETDAWRFLDTLSQADQARAFGLELPAGDPTSDQNTAAGETTSDQNAAADANGTRDAHADGAAAARAVYEAQYARGRQEEQIRAASIHTMGAEFNNEALATELVSRAASIEEAQRAFLNYARDAARDGGLQVSVVAEDRDKFRAAASEALDVRAGILRKEDANQGGDELASLSLVEVARQSLHVANQATGGLPMDLVGRALTTSDFPLVLGATAERSAIRGFETAPETWRDVAEVVNLGDFNQATMVRVTEAEDLLQVGEDGEIKYSKLDEAGEYIQLYTYARLIAITRQAIINDRLGLLTSIPAKFGKAAARKVGDVVYTPLTDSTYATRDGTALFHASHSNLAGAGAVVGSTTLTAAYNAMIAQTEESGLTIDIEPTFFVAGKTKKVAAEEFFGTKFFDAVGAKPNTFAGDFFKRVYDRRLNGTPWFTLGQKGTALIAGFLNGQDRPRIETKAGWTVDGTEWRVAIDVAGSFADFRSGYKNPGA